MPLNVEFVSMLAQAQRAIGINSIDRYVMTLGQVAQLKPDVLDTLDADVLSERYADRMGVDPDLVISGKRLALIREQRAQAQAQAQAVAQAEQAASAAQKLRSVQTGPAPKTTRRRLCWTHSPDTPEARIACLSTSLSTSSSPVASGALEKILMFHARWQRWIADGKATADTDGARDVSGEVVAALSP